MDEQKAGRQIHRYRSQIANLKAELAKAIEDRDCAREARDFNANLYEGLKAARPEEKEPDGYAVLLDDKASAPKGYWIVMAYTLKEIAEREATRSKQGQRVVPFCFVVSPQKAPSGG